MDLGERLIGDCEDLIKSGASIENIREAMNSVYRYYKKEFNGEVRLSDPRLMRLFKLERLMKNNYLPIDSEPVFDPTSDVKFPPVIDSEEKCHEALRAIVHDARMELSEKSDLKVDTLESRCPSGSIAVSRACKKYGVQDKDYGLDMNLGPGLFHCFNIVTFNVNGEEKQYLVDCTYRQFFTYQQAFVERIGIPYNSGSSIGTYMMMDEGRKQIAERILQNGYIEFTDEVCEAYFGGFIFSGRNGEYYSSLGKEVLERKDFEPGYTAREYMMAIANRGFHDERIGRQIGVLGNPNIKYDSVEMMPYLNTKTSSNSDTKKQTI
jgi:hypothetical protein